MIRPRLAIPIALALASFAAPATRADDGSTLQVKKGDRIVLIGNTMAERMQYFGNWETLLHARFPDMELVVRNLGFSADELTLRPRSQGFNDHGNNLTDHKPDVLIGVFGVNESFAGPAGLEKFKADLDKALKEWTTTKYNGQNPPKVVLLSPIAQEDLGDPHITDGKKNNENIKLYSDAMAVAAKKAGAVYVDLFSPTLAHHKMAISAIGDRTVGTALTINGIHLNELGDSMVGHMIDGALFGRRPSTEKIDIARLKAEVNEKNLQFWYDYRAINGCYIYGGRKAPFGIVNFPEEFAKLRKMIAKRDRRVWDVAQGKPVSDKIDDSDSGPLQRIASNVNDDPKITSPAEALKTFKLPEGYKIELYASEVEFPDLKKPVQMTFDAKGRLWVTTMPSYPMYLPGRPVNDKILIFEDSNGDGKADVQTVFADGLHVPTGIELGDGGAYVSAQPNMLFLKDTDGDGKADSKKTILHGFDTADSHHAIHALTWDPGGALYFNEGVFHFSQVETPHGPQRIHDAGIFRFEPKTWKFDIFVTYGFANPWGHYVDKWGQNFVADASGGANYYGTPFSGQVDYPEKHGGMNTFFPTQWRPTCGCELVASRHFPDDTQGDYLLNNDIGFQGILRYRVNEDKSGFKGTAVEPLLSSSDKNFRPTDLEFGPDGALYVVDWFNPLVGHMQHSLRDPKRDVEHGRIWRITYPGRPLVEKAKVDGASIPQLLDLLKVYEDRTRYRARRELREHKPEEVIAALNTWTTGLKKDDPDYWRLRLEGLWLHQSLDEVNEGLLKVMLTCPEPKARAAATRVLCYWRDRVKDPLGLIQKQINDEHPRVRLEAIRALSFFDGKDAAKAQEISLESLAQPQDYYLEYALKETNKTLDQRIKLLAK